MNYDWLCRPAHVGGERKMADMSGGEMTMSEGEAAGPSGAASSGAGGLYPRGQDEARSSEGVPVTDRVYVL